MHPVKALTLSEEVRIGLTNPVQKQLPARALYDDVGSALFEAITLLPEYGLTRADFRVLRAAAPEIARCSKARTVVELGSGTGAKTRIILSAFDPGITYRPVDVSRAALDRCVSELSDYTVRPLEAEFLPGLERAAVERTGAPVLVAFLGSNIGNFDRREIPRFLRSVRAFLRPGDTFLIGADLVKPVSQLLEAYDDPAGVTAAFNRNLLARLNRDLDANFMLRLFDHEARWDATERRIEMHLRARTEQKVTVRALDLEVQFRVGETVWTESSHKFETEELKEAAESAGLQLLRSWTDAEWPFAELLFMVV